MLFSFSTYLLDWIVVDIDSIRTSSEFKWRQELTTGFESIAMFGLATGQKLHCRIGSFNLLLTVKKRHFSVFLNWFKMHQHKYRTRYLIDGKVETMTRPRIRKEPRQDEMSLKDAGEHRYWIEQVDLQEHTT